MLCVCGLLYVSKGGPAAAIGKDLLGPNILLFAPISLVVDIVELPRAGVAQLAMHWAPVLGDGGSSAGGKGQAAGSRGPAVELTFDREEMPHAKNSDC